MTAEDLKQMGVSENAYPFFFDMWNTLLAYFGEERIHFERVSLGVKLIIHYPTLVIKNSLNQEHKSRDFFIYIVVSLSAKLIDFKYSKSTFTYKEAVEGYVHSHSVACKLVDSNRLIRGNFDELKHGRGVCLGSGPILHSIQYLKENTYDPAVFLTLIVEADMNVQWESLEGGPHIKFERVATSTKAAEVLYEKHSSYARFNFGNLLGRVATVHQDDDVTDGRFNLLPICSYFAWKLLDTKSITATQVLDNSGHPKIHICTTDEEICNKILLFYSELSEADRKFYKFVLYLPSIGSDVFESHVTKRQPYYGILVENFIKFKNKHFPLVILRPDDIIDQAERQELTSNVAVSKVILKTVKELIIQSYIFTN